MKYFIRRELNEYGPYTLADLQRYVSQGSILLTDLTRSEGMTEWVPVSQVIGNIPAPAAMPPIQSAVPAAGGTVYGASGTVYDGSTSGYGMQASPVPMGGPVPTDLHWAIVMVLCIFTCTLFGWAWLFVQAAFVRKIRPGSNGLLFAILGFACSFLGGVINGYVRVTNGHSNPSNPIFSLGAIVLVVIGLFQMKSDLEDYYNTVEPINLRLSGVMTFFFGILYFQHHFSRIAEWKKTGVLQPQG
jgi:GYF domain 2